MECLCRTLLERDPGRTVGWPGGCKIQGKHLVLLCYRVAALNHNAALDVELRPGTGASPVDWAVAGMENARSEMRRAEDSMSAAEQFVWLRWST